MSFKRTLLKGTVVLSTLLALNGATHTIFAADKLVDGEYTAVSNPDQYGWSLKHVIVVKDGKIAESKMDYVNDKGDMKSADDNYNTKMKEKSGISGKEAMEQLDKALVEKQSDDIEVVTGATHTTETFIISTKALLEAAKEGKTEVINIDDMALQDGEYQLETPADERGWKHSFKLVVKDGKIAQADYDMLDAEGKKKSENDEYNKMMADKAGVSFADAVKQLNESLVKGQKAEVEVVTGATNTTKAFTEYAKQLLQAAKEGKTEVIQATLIAE